MPSVLKIKNLNRNLIVGFGFKTSDLVFVGSVRLKNRIKKERNIIHKHLNENDSI